MSDARIRELDRRWRESGSLDAGASLLRARVRIGELNEERVATAAALGDSAARSLGYPEPDLTACSCRLQCGVHENAMVALTRREKVSWVLDCQERHLKDWTSFCSNDRRPQRALAAARSWVAGKASSEDVEGACEEARHAGRRAGRTSSGIAASASEYAMGLSLIGYALVDSLAGDRYAAVGALGPLYGMGPSTESAEASWQTKRLCSYLLREEGSVPASILCSGSPPEQDHTYMESVKLRRLRHQGRTNDERLWLAAMLGHAGAQRALRYGWWGRCTVGGELPLRDAFDLLGGRESLVFATECVERALRGNAYDTDPRVTGALDQTKRWLRGEEANLFVTAEKALAVAEAEHRNLPHAVADAAANLALGAAIVRNPDAGWEERLSAAVVQAARARFWESADQRRDGPQRERAERTWQAERLAATLAGEVSV